MSKKLFMVCGEIEIEDVVMAETEAEASKILKGKCRCDTGYVNEFVHGAFFNAREVKKRKDVIADLIDEFPMTDEDGTEYEMTCREVIEILEERLEKEEAQRIMDQKQLKFEFYNQVTK